MNHAATNTMTSSSAFSSLALREALLNNLVSLGFSEMTAIQAQSLPILLQGQDVIAQAKTGSGKTAAFGLSLLNRLDVKKYRVQALVLCPTRELAEQVCQELRRFSRLLPNVKVLNLSGGLPFKPQLDSLRHGAHIIVGTPGRIQKHLDQESLILHNLQSLVLDEADRMLDMGFFDAIKEIIQRCPKQRQTLLFSATYPAEIKSLASEFMKSPKRIIIDEAHSELDIEQVFYECRSQQDKYPVLKNILLHYQPSSTLIFCNTKEQTTQLATALIKDGFSAVALNGDMEQMERDQAIIQFKNKSRSILVATDVAARGLDIKELPAVINFDLAFDHEVHIHRIGRTGRAGSKGLALSLTTAANGQKICLIEENLAMPLTWGKLSELNNKGKHILKPEMVTLCLYAGKKDKIRPGDILGALTKEAGLQGSAIGKIDITTLYSYIAVHYQETKAAFLFLQQGKIKGRKFLVKKIS